MSEKVIEEVISKDRLETEISNLSVDDKLIITLENPLTSTDISGIQSFFEGHRGWGLEFTPSTGGKNIAVKRLY